jgi:hypothetical protein
MEPLNALFAPSGILSRAIPVLDLTTRDSAEVLSGALPGGNPAVGMEDALEAPFRATDNDNEVEFSEEAEFGAGEF